MYGSNGVFGSTSKENAKQQIEYLFPGWSEGNEKNKIIINSLINK